MRPPKRTIQTENAAYKGASEDVREDHSSDSSDQEWNGSAEETSASEASSLRAGRKRRTRGSASGITVPTSVQHVHSHPLSIDARQQHKEDSSGVVKQFFGNVHVLIKPKTSSTLQPITLPQNIMTVYPQLPVNVNLSYVVDDQAVEQQGPTRPIARVRLRPKSTGVSSNELLLYLGIASGAQQYTKHMITGYTAEFGPTTGPRLTLHLKSPTVQEREQAALKAEEQRTGWVVHDCYRAQITQRASKRNRTISLPQQFLNRAFPGVDHKGMKLHMAITKDNIRLPGCDSEDYITYKHVSPRCAISMAAVSALVGCQLEQLRAKPPNLLQVIARTVASSQLSAAVAFNANPTAATATPPPQLACLQPSANSAPAVAATAGQALAAGLSVVPQRAGPSLPEQLVDRQQPEESEPSKTDSRLPAGSCKQRHLDATTRREADSNKRQDNCLKKGASGLMSAEAEMDPDLRAAAAAAATQAPEHSAAVARHLPTAAAASGGHQGALAAAAVLTPLRATTHKLTQSIPATSPSSQVAAATAAEAATAGLHVKAVNHPSIASAAVAQTIKVKHDTCKEDSQQVPASVQPTTLAAAADVICIDLNSDDDDVDDRSHVDHQPTAQVPPIRVKQEPCDAARHQQRAQPPSSGVAVQQTLVRTAAAVDNKIAAVGFKPATQAAVALDSADAAAAGSVKATGAPQLEQPAATLIGGSKAVQQTALETSPMAATAAAASTSTAAVNDAQVQLENLPADFTLADCGHDLLAAGEQLTKLLDLLQASDEQVEQLYRCINALLNQDVDKGKLGRFWFEYSQLQLWVNRRKVSRVRYAVEQLLSLT